MKIALTTDFYWPHTGGGVEAVVQKLATQWAIEGHEVTVVTLQTDDAPADEIVDGVRVVRVDSLDIGRFLHLSLRVPRSLSFLRYLREADVVNLHNPFFSTTLLAGLLLKRPLVTTIHVGSFRNLGRPLSWLVRVFEKTLGRRVLRRSSIITAVSDDAAREASSWNPTCRIEIIPNAVDQNSFMPNGAERPRRLVYVGRLTRNKGAHVLADALPVIMAAHPDARISFVGHGPMDAHLRRRVDDVNTSAVTFHGRVPDIAPYLREAAIYVRPSLTDGMPLTILEAMSCATPVIASDVGGTRELMLHGEHGLLVPAGSSSALAAACIALLGDPIRARTMGKAGRQRILDGPTWQDVGHRYMERLKQAAR